MRLIKIRLAGFKSFVDPTELSFTSNLMSIVGPNGCGKSNIIDAVRWVMGESSAKNLRGESLSDVIFNGSSSRKPVGQATVELVFDNSDGGAGGDYAQYAEISIKRTATRDGTSNYYLNNARCRRKDIKDIFLGTGMGPRSYAIIEQGMISKLIEAKPDELRVFVEEAAGISKYKERRRETENRIRHTRDNLDRLNDILLEQEKQINRLHRQAQAAEKFKGFKSELDKTKSELHALRLQGFAEKLEGLETAIREHHVQLEALRRQQSTLEAEIVAERESRTERIDARDEVQNESYVLGTDIARLEQDLQHYRELAQQRTEDLKKLSENLQLAQLQCEEDQSKVTSVSEQLQTLEPKLQEAREAQTEAQTALKDEEQRQQEWQQEWDAFIAASHERNKKVDVEKLKISQTESQIGRAHHHIDRLNSENEKLNAKDISESLEAKKQTLQEIESEKQTADAAVSEVSEKITQIRQSIDTIASELDTHKSELQTAKGRNASLEALQQSALGKQKKNIQQWLSQHNLGSAPRLAESIKVAQDWELAVETVLGDVLEAVCVDDMAALKDALNTLTDGNVILYDTQNINPAPAVPGERLASKLQSELPLPDVLQQVCVAEDLSQALSMRWQLQQGESVITKDGIWLGLNWIRVAKSHDEHVGVLQREEELKSLATKLTSLQETIEQQTVTLRDNKEQLKTLEQERDTARRHLGQLQQKQADIKASVAGDQAKYDQQVKRAEQIQVELAEHREQIASMDEGLHDARQQVQIAVEAMAEDAQKREALQTRREQGKSLLNEKRQQSRELSDAVSSLAIEVGSLSSQRDAANENITRGQQRIEQLQDQKSNLETATSDAESPEQEIKSALEAKLAARLVVEERLSKARDDVAQIEASLQTKEKQQHDVSVEAQQCSDRLQRHQLDAEGLKVHRTSEAEQLEEMQVTLENVLRTLSEEANEKEWADIVQTLTRKIANLGAINLAAIEEYAAESERREHLEGQVADLNEALATLDAAIQKIDEETRARFKETFDKIDQNYQQLFPRFFGGGKAYLALTGDDLLSTGVAIMAQPPGKRNSTIYLLSGGEKALTAASLVFSIFQLNPAPFCMLDEVDAPLDDANVGRFCKMVKEMSESIQFIYISHNKLAIEMADNLAGVTMKEPGVSRLVSVDVQEATAMVEEA